MQTCGTNLYPTHAHNMHTHTHPHSNITADHMLYTEKDLEKSLDRIEVVNFHQEVEVGGVRFWAYTAGHVLGAAMFMIEIAGVKVS